MTSDLSQDETRAALADLLKSAIDDDRYPLSLRIQRLRAILAKLDPSAVAPTNPYPVPQHYAPPRAALGHRRRAGR